MNRNNLIVGVTLDDLENLPPIIAMLKSLPAKIWVRVVFDVWNDKKRKKPKPPSDYVDALKALTPYVAGILGELLDSEETKYITLEQYRSRVIAYFTELRLYVDVWEVGNEVNGDWRGPKCWEKDVMANAYIREQGGKTAVTLYDDGCALGWVTRLTGNSPNQTPVYPLAFRNSVNWAFVSSYPHDNDGYESNWPEFFVKLGELFPNADLGFGECGMDIENFSDGLRLQTFNHYYRDLFHEITHPRFIGFGGLWYKEDLIDSKALLRVPLSSAILGTQNVK